MTSNQDTEVAMTSRARGCGFDGQFGRFVSFQATTTVDAATQIYLR